MANCGHRVANRRPRQRDKTPALVPGFLFIEPLRHARPFAMCLNGKNI